MIPRDFKVGTFIDYRGFKTPYDLGYGLVYKMTETLYKTGGAEDPFLVYKLLRAAHAFGIPTQAIPLRHSAFTDLLRTSATAIAAPLVEPQTEQLRRLLASDDNRTVEHLQEAISHNCVKDILHGFLNWGNPKLNGRDEPSETLYAYMALYQVNGAGFNGWATLQERAHRGRVKEARRLVKSTFKMGPWGGRPMWSEADHRKSFEQHFRIWMLLNEGVSEYEADFDRDTAWDNMQLIMDNGRYKAQRAMDRHARFDSGFVRVDDLPLIG